jgi:hypothetical protein
VHSTREKVESALHSRQFIPASEAPPSTRRLLSGIERVSFSRWIVSLWLSHPDSESHVERLYTCLQLGRENKSPPAVLTNIRQISSAFYTTREPARFFKEYCYVPLLYFPFF